MRASEGNVANLASRANTSQHNVIEAPTIVKNEINIISLHHGVDAVRKLIAYIKSKSDVLNP